MIELITFLWFNNLTEFTSLRTQRIPVDESQETRVANSTLRNSYF